MTDVVRGLARNPAAPDDVLLGLLEVAPEEAADGLEKRRELSLTVQEAMLRHPLGKVRGVLARHPRIDPGLREQLLFGPDVLLAAQAFGRPGQPPLSEDVLSRLLLRIQDTEGELMTSEELWGDLPQPGPFYLRPYVVAARHPDPRVREHATRVASSLDESLQSALLADPVADIRARTAGHLAEAVRPKVPADLPDGWCHAYWWVLHQPLSRELVDHVLAGGAGPELSCLAANGSTPPDVVEQLSGHADPEVRRRLATRPDLTGAQLLRLVADPDVSVRTRVSVHPGLTEEQRAAIVIDVPPVSIARDDEWPPVASPADAVRWARSVNPLLRRSAARQPGLPDDLVTALAGDADPGVRVLLALHHPQAPPALLLECFLTYRGHGRERLTQLPQFSIDGDPGDPDPAVRRAVAASPNLPVGRIVALLDDPGLAGYAAANPALPVERMTQIVRTAGS